jgi:predicted esterase
MCDRLSETCRTAFRRRQFGLALAGTWFAAAVLAEIAPAEDAAYIAKVRVAAETRLDWAYPLLERSPAKPQAGLLGDYHWEAQTYEFFGPADGGGGNYPLVIFVSPQDRPVSWPFWEPTCRAHGVLFAGVRDMGNGKPLAHRVRAVLEVLDDVRERFGVDPDRTYLAGFSGGAQVACVAALHLPEYFGGVMCLGHAPQPPQEPWLLERVRERLSVAIVCGDREPAGPLVEDLFGPWWEGAGVRVEPVILRRHSHTMPDAEVMESAFEWVEADVAQRRETARKYPASRIADAPSRDQWADRLLADAKSRLADPTDVELVDAGLRQLEGIVERWPDVPAAEAARRTLDEYATRADRPWEKVRDAAERELLLVQAEGYARVAGDGRGPAGDQRGQYAKYAIALWQRIRTATNDAEAIAAADAQIAALEKIAAAAPAEAKPMPLGRARFDLSGDVTLAQGVAYLRTAVARLGYELEMDEAAVRAAGVDLNKVHHPRLKAVEFEDIDRRFLRRAGVMSQRQGKIIRLVPVESK